MAVNQQDILNFAESKGVVIEKEALTLLQNVENYRNLIEKLVESGYFIISANLVRRASISLDAKVAAATQQVVVLKSGFKAKAKDVEPNFRILEEYDVTNQSFSEGSIKNFLRYFQDKFIFLSSLLEKRIGFHPRTITGIKKAPNNENVETIGMVNKKWLTKKGSIALQIEDLDDECIVIIPQNNRRLVDEAALIVLDSVIGVRGTKIGNEMILANEIIWPDLPMRQPKKAERDLSVIVMADMHVGSKLFLEKEFLKFTNWLKGNALSATEREHIGKIKYLFIVGDNVDGVGVYPEQYDELVVKDIYEQYSMLASYLSQIPEYIQIFICPGQHDAVRRADPQPAIPKEYVKEFAGFGNVFFIGSPSWVEVEGLKCLIYHGASLHDLYTSGAALDASQPHKAMIEALKRRDLMMGYGSNNPYVPEQKDFMLIREEPDFYFGGDMHHIGYEMYRGCLVVCGSTWQKQTEYQIRQGHSPTPGIIPEINLKTRHIRENHFYTEK